MPNRRRILYVEHVFKCPHCGIPVSVQGRDYAALFKTKYALCTSCLKVFNISEIRIYGKYAKYEHRG